MIEFSTATFDEADALARLQTAAADDLTVCYGKGHWSSAVTVPGVLYQMRTGTVVVGKIYKRPVATFRLSTKKPWAIDATRFTAGRQPLYLLNMAVEPSVQRQGIGRQSLDEARRIARAWPADAIRLDAYDAAAGAGAFYAKCGFREVARADYRGVPLIYFELLL